MLYLGFPTYHSSPHPQTPVSSANILPVFSFHLHSGVFLAGMPFALAHAPLSRQCEFCYGTGMLSLPVDRAEACGDCVICALCGICQLWKGAKAQAVPPRPPLSPSILPSLCFDCCCQVCLLIRKCSSACACWFPLFCNFLCLKCYIKETSALSRGIASLCPFFYFYNLNFKSFSYSASS